MSRKEAKAQWRARVETCGRIASALEDAGVKWDVAVAAAIRTYDALVPPPHVIRCDDCGRTGTDDRQFISTLEAGGSSTLCGECADRHDRVRS